MPETVDIDKLQPVYNELKSLLCCDRCTMRLLNITGETLNYVSPNEYLEKVKLNFKWIVDFKMYSFSLIQNMVQYR